MNNLLKLHSYVRIEDRIKPDEFGFTLSRDEKSLSLNIVNDYGNTAFAREADMKISSVRVESLDGKFFPARREGAGAHVLKGAESYTRLAYDHHPDGSICGWQLTPFRSAKLPDGKKKDFLSIRANVGLFLGDVERDRPLKIDFSIPLGDIPLMQGTKPGEQPP